MIFDIKKFAIHDGPGIRTTVFFHGCPLNCMWCHNPECKVENNSRFASMNQHDIFTTVMREIKKDTIFYDQSGGGVTFSGGEPFMQTDLLFDLLSACKDSGIHTAVDTCGFTEFANFERVFYTTDLFLYDLKFIDDSKHRKYTEVSNEIILENLKKLSALDNKIMIRIPLIPEITDTEENLREIGEYIMENTNTQYVEVLPYNLFGQSKYSKLNIPNKLKNLKLQSEEVLASKVKLLETFGFNVKH